MKLLLYSPAFLPHIGGLELNVAHMAEEFSRAGHQVIVATTTAGEVVGPEYGIARQPSRMGLLRLVRWCDVYFQANVSLKGLWPLALVRRPWVVSHHSWYCRTDGRVAWQDKLKRRVLRHATASIAVSQALANDIGASLVIPNTYRDELFRLTTTRERFGDLLFVGRLVSDKGVDVLLEAMSLLAKRGSRPNLSIVGEGPERPAIEQEIERQGLTSQVVLLGKRTDEDLVQVMNSHRALIVPSRYREPFGIVALEGMACGCFVIGSEGGGLPEAIGPGGQTFPNGNATALADLIAESVASLPRTVSELPPAVRRHLREHSTAEVLRRYLYLLGRVVDGEPRLAAS